MEDIILANEQLNKWCGTEGINYHEGDTALGFLFKYAVPKVVDPEINFYQFDEKSWEVTIAYKSIPLTGVDDDPALALFWAIYKTLGGEELW